MAEEHPAERSIEAFFLLSTLNMEKQSQIQRPLNTNLKATGYEPMRATSPRSASNDITFKFDFHDDRNMPAATITNIANEPVFWHGYTSDEEAASPLGLNDMDWDESDDASISDLPSLDDAEEPRSAVVEQAHQLCTHAQAVTIISAGRPKMVSVARSLPNRSNEKMVPFHMRTHSLDQPGRSRSSSDYSQKDSLDSSGRVSPLSTAPSSLYESQPRSKRTSSISSKHVPLMEAARWVPQMDSVRLGSPIMPMSPMSPAASKNSYTWSQPQTPNAAPHGPRSSSITQIKSGVSALINRFDSSESAARRGSTKPRSKTVGRVGKNILRRDTLADVEAEYIARVAAPEHQLSQPASPVIRLPVRESSFRPPKMVARGANERSPILTLPTCPNEPSFSDASEWPSFTTQSTQAPSARITTVA